MFKYPFGFYAALLFLLLGLVLVSPSHGQEIVISETIWNGIKIEFAQLKTHSESLRVSLDSSASTISELKISSANLWLELNETKNELAASNSKLRIAETQAALLGDQLKGSELSLNKAMNTIRRDKIKAYAIGGAVGIVVGAVATGIIISLAN